MVFLQPLKVIVGVWLALIHACYATQFFTADALPQGVSPDCADALTQNVDCSLAVIYLQPDEFYPKKSLDKICTSACGSALASWKSTIASSCADDHFPGFNKEDGEMPLGAIPDAIKFTYDLTCLKEGSRYCNNAAASLAANGDPDAAHLPGGLPGSGDWGGQNVTSNCDQCIVSLLRFRASSPYYGGPVLRSSSVYESRTSSCKIAGSPLTTSSSPFKYGSS